MVKTLTFAETLHPEEGAHHLGLQDEERGWWRVVSNETRINDNYPTAVARRVDDNDEEDNVNQGHRQDVNNDQELALVVDPHTNLAVVSDGNDNSTDANNITTQQETNVARRPSGKGCFFLEGLVGYTFTLVAVSCAFGMELGAAIIYTTGAGFYYITTFDAIGIFFKALFLLIVQLFVVLDAIILTLSVMITELIGALSCITTLFMVISCRNARDWPLYIRRMCHATRWAFRGFHKRWALQRTYPVDVFNGASNDNSNHIATSTKSDEAAASAAAAVSSSSFAEIEEPPTSIAAENIVVVDHVGYDDEKK